MSEHNTKNDSNPLPGFDLLDIFDNAPVGIFTSTPEGDHRILRVKRPLAQRLKHTPHELKSLTCHKRSTVFVPRRTIVRIPKRNNIPDILTGRCAGDKPTARCRPCPFVPGGQ